MWLQSVVGISVVFLALVALSFFIYIFGKVMKNGGDKSKKKLESVSSIEVEANVDDDELIAVITAAIQASLQKAGITPECRIVVKSFNRVEDGTPVWNKTGRKEVLN
jgi:sodium pump decarboxylase gamma subunit